MGVLLFWAGRSEVDRFLGMEEARGSNPRQSIFIKVQCIYIHTSYFSPFLYILRNRLLEYKNS